MYLFITTKKTSVFLLLTKIIYCDICNKSNQGMKTKHKREKKRLLTPKEIHLEEIEDWKFQIGNEE